MSDWWNVLSSTRWLPTTADDADSADLVGRLKARPLLCIRYGCQSRMLLAAASDLADTGVVLFIDRRWELLVVHCRSRRITARPEPSRKAVSDQLCWLHEYCCSCTR